MSKDQYQTAGMIVGAITFVISWVYCIASYGFLFGVGLGWIPSLIVAWIAGALWPVVVLAIAALGLFIFISVK